MTVREALTAIKGLKPSQYDDNTLVRWLSELDRRVYDDILCRYEGVRERTGFHRASREDELTESKSGKARNEDETRHGPLPLDADRDIETKLLIPFPHDALYIKWLGAQIDYHNAEFERYNNGMVMFNAGYQAFGDWYNRTHMPAREEIRGIRGYRG